MRKTIITSLIISFLFNLTSCSSGSGNHPATAEGFSAIEADIKKEFGADAYFTDLSIIYDEAIGNMISLAVTDEPESLKMGEWNYARGTWNQNAEIFLELPANTQATDFMYQLGDKISLATLGKLIEKSKKQLTEEKGLENPVLSMASIKFPDNGDLDKTEYVIKLEPENGGTSFNFYYTLNEELLDMNY